VLPTLLLNSGITVVFFENCSLKTWPQNPGIAGSNPTEDVTCF